MEYDSGSSCEGRVKDLEDSEVPERINEGNRAERESCLQPSTSHRWYNTDDISSSKPTILPVVAKRTLSSQVMEYYQKYSQSTSLGRYFSLPEPGSTFQSTNYQHRLYVSGSEPHGAFESYVVLADDERSKSDCSIPRERRRWARPPLIGQPSSSDGQNVYVGVDSRTPSPISKRPINETIPEERNESRETLVELRETETKPNTSSPTSSVASHKPLEWDSGADVGYYNELLPRTKEKEKQLCTIERMALKRGCSVAMRLDPEGTNESTTSSRIGVRASMRPDASSTPLVIHVSGESESEIEITPVVKAHSTAMIKVCEEKSSEFDNKTGNESEQTENKPGAPNVQNKYPAEGSRSKEEDEKGEDPALSPLKKSSSMNLLALPLSKLSLKRSQSELNLRAKEKKVLPLIFDSMSSIATIVNKPATCDKFIQTSLDSCSRESVGIQVEVRSDNANNGARGSENREEMEGASEEKPPLPKRGSSLAPKSLHSILKNSSNTYTVRDRNVPPSVPEDSHSEDKRVEDDAAKEKVPGTRPRTRGGGRPSESNSSSSKNESPKNESCRNESSSEKSEILVETEDATGRASNSFEYFPGHVYQNVPNGSTSQVSSCDTGRESRCSTMPNTSSSIDEKLWGDSDSLVRDLERSVNILKSLVDANKCDKQVKKRLIHHVVKRLVTAKYTDDRIERDLEENVPWNPADARNKVYRSDIIQALANNKQRNTTDSSEDWRPRKRSGARSSPKKSLSKETRVLKEIIDLGTSRESTMNSDKFDRHTDRTVMDGRKARMGLRSEDQPRETDGDKSQSSECFVPQNQHKIKSTNLFYSVEKNRKPDENPSRDNLARDVATGITSDSSTSRKDLVSDRIILVKERRRNDTNETDWRLPTTMSERRFELGRSNSESGDTKLISYAEMEKRNQLVWITNEISHLCNLKRLLEEPNKIEASSRGANSPRKRLDVLGSWIVQADRNSSSRVRGSGSEATPDDLLRVESLEKALENQWSSHGNLAIRTEEKAAAKLSERVGPTRKRNSCTQTGSDGGPSGHSKTGGEIVSASLPFFSSLVAGWKDQKEGPVMRDASVQTRSASPEKIQSNGTSRTNSDPTCSRLKPEERAHSKFHRHVCYCQRYAAHSRHRACVIHSPERPTRSKNCPGSDERPIITQSVSNRPGSRKEAKNQLNATCKSNYAVRELPVRRDRCERCDKVSQPEVVPIRKPEIKEQKGNDCVCQRERGGYESNREGSVSPCETGSEFEEKYRCTCKESWDSRTKNEEVASPRNGFLTEVDPSSEKTRKSCRTCGTIWSAKAGKNANRKCECTQDYLKPVAYELKFDETGEKSKNVEKKKIKAKPSSIVAKDAPVKTHSRATQSGPVSEQSQENCACNDDEKRSEDVDNGEECPETLKDFLATNRPEFLENVETRLRYMSELSQLRQLKREKRKQFLAMTGGSNYLKTQRQAKSTTVSTPRKLSDYELKLRLRMRYLRLNEVRNKRRQREKEEDLRRNHLMAKLFGQKLQQKVLKGQVDLSQSVSVISNL